MFGMLSLRVKIFLLFALICLGGSVLFLAGLIIGYLRLSDPAALSSFVIAGVIGICAIFGLSAWVWIKFDDHVAKPVERLAAELRARAHSGVDLEIDREAARFLGDLAPAAAAVTEKLSEARNATAHEVGRAIARTGREKAQLAAMLAEVPTGVVFCGPDD
ncbi:MAG: 3'-5' exonuclease, partial [Pseudomonadota bacterium]